MSVREGLTFETELVSDSAALHTLVSVMLDVTPEIHCLRDATRGGVAAVLNELAEQSRVGFELDETMIPVRPAVMAACEMLGMDPLYVASEGKLVAMCQRNTPTLCWKPCQHPLGQDAAIMGHVVDDHPGMVVARGYWRAARVNMPGRNITTNLLSSYSFAYNY
jgi:hydrogenase expression/formation protein HypE